MDRLGRSVRSFFAIAALLGAVAASAAPADDVKALLDQGRSAEAYALGKKFPGELGNPVFDFYFGVAAIDTGHAGEGVLALERYIANFPDNLQARLELARGYFVLGDDARAREEFDLVMKAGPPPAVQANIHRFLDAIRARESRYRTTAGFYLEAGIGTDSNVNAGVSSPNINLPVFGNVTITGAGVKTGDTFTHLGLGGHATFPIAPGIALFGAANGEFKLHHNDKQFDQYSYGAAGGLTYLKEKNLLRATASQSVLEVEGDRFRTVTGASGELHHQLDELQGLNGYLQYADLDYPGPNEIRTAKFYALGAGYRKAFIGAYQPLLTASLNYGEEDNLRNRPDLGRKLHGARVGVSLTPMPKWSLNAGLSYQRSKYMAPDPLLRTTRKDDYYAADASVSYAITRNLLVRGEYQHVKNDSNLALYEYNRNLFAVKLRYEFK
jgi:hypothetical protein